MVASSLLSPNGYAITYRTIDKDDISGETVDANSGFTRWKNGSTCDKLFYFVAGAFFMAIVSASASRFALFSNGCYSNIAKELAIDESEITKDRAEIAEETVELKTEEAVVEADAEELARLHALLSRERAERCRNVDWITACDRVGNAGARRRRRLEVDVTDPGYLLEEALLDSDSPSVVFDENCLRLYRLNMAENMTFPYHASQLLRRGGKQTMALFIQHGAMRDADHYFCSFAELMLNQDYRPFEDILVIAPSFEYRRDSKVYPYDAFWNSTKPWGDWRDGAQSDPLCCGNKKGISNPRTVSSFDVLDQMLAILTDSDLYPNLNKISILGHSAGGQMVQRFSVMSLLAAAYDEDEIDWIDLLFVVANPSSYTYLDGRRFSYNCGHCLCDEFNCTCPESCTEPSDTLSIPSREGVGKAGQWPCFDSAYNNWPYGITKIVDPKHMVPYVIKSNPLRASRMYYKRHVVYLVGQNDTCNDGLPVCDSSCWKRTDYDPVEEWPCFRNQMDTRCPAMMEGPNRRIRGQQYMKYLEDFYGRPTHKLYVVDGMGHNATGMFGSEIGLKIIFS